MRHSIKDFFSIQQYSSTAVRGRCCTQIHPDHCCCCCRRRYCKKKQKYKNDFTIENRKKKSKGGGPRLGFAHTAGSQKFCLFFALAVSTEGKTAQAVKYFARRTTAIRGRAGGGGERETLAAEIGQSGSVLCSMENDFVDVFPSAGGVGDSPVKASASEDQGSSWSRPSLSLSIPGLDTGGREALVSPAVSGSRGVNSLAKEGVLRSARAVSAATREDDIVMLDTPSESPAPRGMSLMPLTIDPGGECMPTELEKKRAKLEKYRYECSEVG